MIYDVVIVGAGVSGSAIARELSRYNAQVLVIEACEDVCCGTSKANSAIVHAGYDCQPGSMMAKMNIRGNEIMGKLADDLDIPFERTGSLVVCTDETRFDGLKDLHNRGLKNGVPGMRILSREEALAREPQLSETVVGALWAPTAGIICPFTLTIALAESAYTNGVKFQFDTRVQSVARDAENLWQIKTSKGTFVSRSVVNAAGLYADELHNMVSPVKIHITPRKGEYLLFDRSAQGFVTHVIFPQPTQWGKGVLVAPTVHGNILAGPTSNDLDDEEKEQTATTREGLATLRGKASDTVRDLPFGQVITNFAGLRAHEDHHDFVVGQAAGALNFFDCAGIESPGLTSAPALGEYLARQICNALELVEKTDWIATRRGIVDFSELSFEQRNELIKVRPAYGQIICRCETVTEGEIIDAIRRPLGAHSLDGIKRRVRAGSGRCQAGFCSPRVMDILARELDVPLEKITKSGGSSTIVTGRSKEVQSS